MPELINDGCPFCFDNGKLEAIAWLPAWRKPRHANAYLVRDTGFPKLDVFLIIPFGHVEDLERLPHDWGVTVKALIKQIPGNDGTREIITTTNFGLPDKRALGVSVQTVGHLHMKVILVPNDIPVKGLTSYHNLERELQRVRPGTSISQLVGTAVRDFELQREMSEFGLD